MQGPSCGKGPGQTSGTPQNLPPDPSGSPSPGPTHSSRAIQEPQSPLQLPAAGNYNVKPSLTGKSMQPELYTTLPSAPPVNYGETKLSPRKP